MKFTFSILALFLALAGHAQTRDTLYLWPDKVPGELKAKRSAIVSGNSSGNVIRLAEVTNPSLVVFEPAKPNSSGVGIIVCPGGGYNILAVDKEGYEIAEWLNSLGYTAFVLQYRIPNKQKGALNDAQRAVRLVRSKAYEYNLHPERIGMIGFSAGASLCARTSTQFKLDSYAKIEVLRQN